ncbi:hypothetical protein [Nonomuraea gerenzanensis]|uniref:Putative isomerase n=1 Tax=Nonomuraea gerenzanensis TaxID=93944 RepID=A0A1M4ENS1_9ACTN|nr:hypothetical protein [Nonomuraea gerenzanensis]UBU11990.1 hypothetical protein LCN96_48135 [Nonomuraea gerenzanensis]SBP00506.1 putative isomerase [Nonomuraea gerenzanensis]
MNFDVKQLTDRYIAQWNEPDPATRATLIRDLWASDAVHVITNPPEAVRDAAAALALPAPALEARGHAALEARVGRAYEMFVEAGEYVFEAAGEAVLLLPHVVGVRWSMVSTRTGEVAGGGLDVLAVGEDGRVRSDHQFVGGS